jgi:hypothetical protein
LTTKKKKQHYVWQHYLRPWTNDEQIHCYRSAAKHFLKTGTSSIANQTYFYQSHRLTPEELKYVELLINKAADEDLKELHRGTLRMFQQTFDLRDKLENFPMSAQQRVALEDALHEADQTLGEAFHTQVEDKTFGILDALRNSDPSFYSDLQQCIDFIYFLAHQAFRTPKLRTVVAGLQAKNPYPNVNLEKIWLIESHIYATNVSRGIFAEWRAYKFTFIENDTPVPYITGDQPIVNLNTHKDETLKLYYPLSPKLALIFEKDESLPLKTVQAASSSEVEFYNRRIFAGCTDQIYSDNENYLKTIAERFAMQ